MTEFGIESMTRHENGYFVAEVLSYRDQQTYALHNRYGSWIIGEPNRKGGRAPETISKALPFALQDRLAIIKKELDKMTSNPFAAPNPFLATTGSTTPPANPFMA